MTTYKLDETPDTYISALEQGSYMYTIYSFKEELSNNYVDLRKDKLIIHGTEIKESMWEKLRNSLLLRGTVGKKLYVNCNGAFCIIEIQSNNSAGFKCYRPINDVTFDWSQFGVIVPNSVNDSLIKQLQKKDQKLTRMSTLLCSAKGEASACRKLQQDTEMELQMVRNQLCVKEIELNATKTKLELSKEEVKELQDQVSSSNKKDDYRNLRMELQLTKSRLEASDKKIMEFEKRVSSGGRVQEQPSLVMDELQPIKGLVDTAEKEVDLED